MTFACLNSSEEIVQFLIEHGCDVNQKNRFDQVTPWISWTYKFIDNNPIDTEKFQSISDLYDDIISKNSFSILFYVAGTNRISVAELLIDNGADPNESNSFASPLCMAIAFNNIEMVKFLISRGVDINKPSLYPPIFLTEGSEILEYLIKCGANISSQILPELIYNISLYKYRFTILCPIVIECCTHLLKSLLKYNLRVDFCPVENSLINYFINIFPPDESPSQIKNVIEMFEILCEAGVGLYDSPDYPLIFNYAHEPEFFKYLINKGFNIGSLQEGKNIIHALAIEGNIDLLKYVLQYNIPTYKTDNLGFTPYDYAIGFGHIEIACLLDSLNT